MSKVLSLRKYPDQVDEKIRLRQVMSKFEDRINNLMIDPEQPNIDDMHVLMMSTVFLKSKLLSLPLYFTAEYLSLLLVSYMFDENFLHNRNPSKCDLWDLAFLNSIIGPQDHQQKYIKDAEGQYYAASIETTDEDKRFFFESLIWNIHSVQWILRDFYRDITSPSLTRIK